MRHAITNIFLGFCAFYCFAQRSVVLVTGSTLDPVLSSHDAGTLDEAKLASLLRAELGTLSSERGVMAFVFMLLLTRG